MNIFKLTTKNENSVFSKVRHRTKAGLETRPTDCLNFDFQIIGTL
jgi:hypothetical protein